MQLVDVKVGLTISVELADLVSALIQLLIRMGRLVIHEEQQSGYGSYLDR